MEDINYVQTEPINITEGTYTTSNSSSDGYTVYQQPFGGSNTFTQKLCDTCRGTGYIGTGTCFSCGGKGWEMVEYKADVEDWDGTSHTEEAGFQKCPICDGHGVVPNQLEATLYENCPTCNGRRIINKKTGLPPQ